MHAWEAIQKSIDYIEDNLAEPLEIETLAQVASLSVFYYQRLFTRLVKISVREYIKLRRLARAAHLLKDRKSRVIEVAFKVESLKSLLRLVLAAMQYFQEPLKPFMDFRLLFTKKRRSAYKILISQIYL